MTSFVGTNPNQVPTNSDLGRFAFVDYIGWDDTGASIPVIASATVITPVLKISKVSGTAAISTILPPVDLINGGQLVLIPTGRFSFNTTGNIALAITAEVSKPITLTYEAVAKKWYPGYSNTINNLNVNSSLSNNVSLNISDSLTLVGDDTITILNGPSVDYPLNPYVSIATVSGNFTCGVVSKKLVIGMQVIITGTNTGPGSIPLGTYYIIATNDTTTFQLSATFGGSPVITTIGAVNGLVFTLSPLINFGRGGTVVYNDYTSKLNVFAPTSSTELSNVISDYTGTPGYLVYSASPTLSGNVLVDGTLTVNSTSTAKLASSTSSFDLVNETVATLNIGGAATVINIGSTTSGSVVNCKNDLTALQNITAYNSSDKRLKENITPISNPIEKLLKLSGNTFKWTAEYYATQNQSLVKSNDVGVIAQEVIEVLPEAVHERDNGILAVDYQKLIPLLIECIKAQQVQIDELKRN